MKCAIDYEILILKEHFTQTDNKLIILKAILGRYKKEITSKKFGREQKEYSFKQMMKNFISLKSITANYLL